MLAIQTYFNELQSSINEQKNSDKLKLIYLKKQQIWQITQLYGQYLEAKTLLKNLLEEFKSLDLSLESEIKADILKIFELGDREDIDSYLCVSIVQVYTYFQEIEKSLIELKKGSDRSFI